MDASVEQRVDNGEQEQRKVPLEQPPPYTEPQSLAQPQTEPTAPVIQQPAMVAVEVVLGPDSTPLVCPFCHAAVQTKVIVLNNSRTHLYSMLLCLVGGVCCAWIPYCMDSCRSKKHFCPNCGKYIGTYDD